MSAQSELQALAELDQLQETIDALRGELEDEKGASAFLADLVTSYAYAEGWINFNGFTPEQYAFLQDQYPDAPDNDPRAYSAPVKHTSVSFWDKPSIDEAQRMLCCYEGTEDCSKGGVVWIRVDKSGHAYCAKHAKAKKAKD